MKLEKFNYSSGKRGRWFLYGVICTVLLMVLINLFFSEAKYYNTESIPIAKGIIKNYSPTDFKLLAIKLENDSGEYENTDKIPESGSGYALNTESSYCTVPNADGEEIKDSSVIINYHNGMVDFNNLTTKNTKCYLYFDIFNYTQIINYTMLYYYGDEYTDVTGGWGSGYGTQRGGAFTSSYFKTNNNFDSSLYTAATIKYMYNTGDTGSGGNKGHFNVGTFGGRVLPSSATTYKNELLLLTAFDKTKGNVYIGVDNGNSSSHSEQKNSDHLYTYIYQSSYYVYTLRVYAIAFYKEDDWSTLAKIAGISAASINDILYSSTTLLSSKDAIIYMLYNCTGDFMASAITSSTFLSALNNSPYKDLVYENEHWSKFLSMVS